jgi:hypothetical protein
VTAADARHELASVLAAQLPGWSVYAEPPATVHAPAIAMGPGDPYRKPQGYRLDDVRIRLALFLSEGSQLVLDLMDDALDTVLSILRTQPIVAVESVSQVGRVTEVGGVGYLGAVIDLTLGIERTKGATA